MAVIGIRLVGLVGERDVQPFPLEVMTSVFLYIVMLSCLVVLCWVHGVNCSEGKEKGRRKEGKEKTRGEEIEIGHGGV